MTTRKVIKKPFSRVTVPGASQQTGAVLLVGLLILLILTLIGTSSMSSVTLEERMVSNMQNVNKAFQGSEAGLAECEEFIRSADYGVLESELTDNLGDIASGNRIASLGLFGNGEWWDSKAFWAANGWASQLSGIEKSAGNPDGLWAAPRCVIEFVGNGGSSMHNEDLYAGSGTSRSDQLLYRVTASSLGSDTSGQSIVESLFVK